LITRLRRLRPSPALVIACLALLVALAGTSVAAVQAVIPRNSVGALQLKANSVNSSKVLNHSLLRSDFRPGQIPAGARGPAGPAGAAGPAGPAGPAGVVSPGYVAEVLTQTSADPTEVSSTTFAALGTSSLNVNIPTDEKDKLLVFFNAESACYGGTAGERCLVRIMVDNDEIDPHANTDSYFDNNGATSTSLHQSSTQSQHGIVRISPTLSAGAHTVRIEVATTSAGTKLRLDDWTLAVQRIRVA
jgi:hypothetical protein